MNIIISIMLVPIIGLLCIGIQIGIIFLIYKLIKKIIKYNAELNKKNEQFRAGIKKSDMQSYEEWKAERQKQEP